MAQLAAITLRAIPADRACTELDPSDRRGKRNPSDICGKPGKQGRPAAGKARDQDHDASGWRSHEIGVIRRWQADSSGTVLWSQASRLADRKTACQDGSGGRVSWPFMNVPDVSNVFVVGDAHRS